MGVQIRERRRRCSRERERERAIINNGWQVKQYEMKSHKPVKIIDESGI